MMNVTQEVPTESRTSSFNSTHVIPRRTVLFTALAGLLPLVLTLLPLLFVKNPDTAGFRSWLGDTGSVTMLTCLMALWFAVFSLRAAHQRLTTLQFSTIAFLLSAINLQQGLLVLVPPEHSGWLLRLSLVCALALSGATYHFISTFTRRLRLVPFVYVCCAVAAVFSLLLPQPRLSWQEAVPFMQGPAFRICISLMLGILVVATVQLCRHHRQTDDPLERHQDLNFLGALGVSILLGLATIPAHLGLPGLPLYNLSFIPLALLTRGTFLPELIHPGLDAQIKPLSSHLFSALTLFYGVLLVGCCWLLKDYDAAYILHHVFPYGLPALLTFIVAAGLSLLVLQVEQSRRETTLFTLICLGYATLNLDILLMGIVKDAQTALLVSRCDHFFLALIFLGVNLHFTFLIADIRRNWWMVHLAYLIGIVMAPLSQCDLYFQGMYTYSWGFFARKAPLYDFMSMLWIGGTFFSIILISWVWKQTDNPRRRNILKLCIIGFVISALLTLTNTPALYGHEIYPLGTFSFVALLVLAYALLKQNLRTTVFIARTVLHRLGLVCLLTLIGLLPRLLTGRSSTAALVGGVILMAFSYRPVFKAWDRLLIRLFNQQVQDLQENFYELSQDLSRVHRRHDTLIHLSMWLFDAVLTSRCTMLTRNPQKDTFEGWELWNPESDLGMFAGDPRLMRDEHDINIPVLDALDKLARSAPLITPDRLRHACQADEQLAQLETLKGTEVIIPVRFSGEISALVLLGNKINGAAYTRTEQDILTSLASILGPHLENARLLEGLQQEVDLRTKDLNEALIEAMQKEKEVRAKNDIITRRNESIRTLLETSTHIFDLENLDELLSFTLEQLKRLYPDLAGGIILEGERPSIVESAAFTDINEATQELLLHQRHRILAEGTGLLPVNEDASWTAIPLTAPGGRTSGLLVIRSGRLEQFDHEIIMLFLRQISAVAQNRMLLDRLAMMASTDGLTGAYNRAYLDEQLARSINHARRYRTVYFALMAIDVNGLKRINDTCGHASGDDMICRVADMLQSVCRTTDIVARTGGDEFVILMPGTNRCQANILMDRIRETEEKLELPLPCQAGVPRTEPIRISIGLAASDECPPEEVFKQADERMYANKKVFYKVHERYR